MSLTTTPGSSSADAYVSVVDADTYHTNHSGSTVWSGADAADKEKAIRLATQYIDLTYGLRWKGSRSNEDQSLDWPRQNVSDRDGWSVDSTVIPPRVEDAASEMALRSLSEDILPDLATPGALKSKRVRAGEVSVAKEYLSGSSPFKKYTSVERLLQQFLEQVGTIGRS